MLALPVCAYAQLALDLPTDRHAAWIAAIRLTALMAAAFLARDLVNVRRRAIFLRAIAWIGLAAAIVATVTHALTPASWWPLTSRNHLAEFLELVFPVALWLGLTERAEPYLWIAAALLAAGIASASRAGAILLLAEACLVGRAFLWGGPSGPPPRFRAAIPGRRPAFLFLALAATFTIVLDATPLLRRFTTDPLQYRREIAHSTLAMIRDHPWTGSGLGSFVAAYPAYAEFDSGRTVDHAHNDWLEFAAEGGIPYAILWTAVAAIFALPAIRTGWGIGILAVFLHALVDFPLARSDVALGLFIFLGAIERTRAENTLNK